VDPVRLGSAFRAIRIELRLRQSDVARRARVSQQLISRIECGQLAGLAIPSIEAAARALGADLTVELRWRGPSLPRLLDRRHAALQDAIAGQLIRAGWQVRVEESFNRYGERGSVDVLAWHPTRLVLLIVEVKTEIADLQETIRVLDMKARVVPTVVRGAHGWRPRSVAVVLALPDTTMNRSAVDRHEALMAAAFPARTRQVSRWLAAPAGDLRGLAFVRYTHTASTGPVGGPTRRVSGHRKARTGHNLDPVRAAGARQPATSSRAPVQHSQGG
jgi:transcriptional regulator with XRE-family HTH domain